MSTPTKRNSGDTDLPFTPPHSKTETPSTPSTADTAKTVLYSPSPKNSPENRYYDALHKETKKRIAQTEQHERDKRRRIEAAVLDNPPPTVLATKDKGFHIYEMNKQGEYVPVTTASVVDEKTKYFTKNKETEKYESIKIDQIPKAKALFSGGKRKMKTKKSKRTKKSKTRRRK
jgi:hypothetical protein